MGLNYPSRVLSLLISGRKNSKLTGFKSYVTSRSICCIISLNMEPTSTSTAERQVALRQLVNSRPFVGRPYLATIAAQFVIYAQANRCKLEHVFMIPDDCQKLISVSNWTNWLASERTRAESTSGSLKPAGTNYYELAEGGTLKLSENGLREIRAVLAGTIFRNL